MQLRVARHTDRLGDLIAFYRDGVGLTEIGGFHDHDGYDGVFLALPGSGAHLEFTSGGVHRTPDPHPESLLVIYLDDADAVGAVTARLGVDPVVPENPYWAEHGTTVEDPDGFRVVLVPEPWEDQLTSADLYARGVATLVGSWEEYARGAAGAVVQRSPGVTAAVFPSEPERTFYNNALLEQDLSATERVAAADSMGAAYEAAGVRSYAAWIHESDGAMRTELEGRGYTLEQVNRAMGMALDDLRQPRPVIEPGPPDWSEYLSIIGVPVGLLSGADRAAFHVLVARLDGENVAAAMAFDLDGDCGLYNVTTLGRARRRGLGSALTLLHLHDALARGCQTASLQSTAIAERVYAAVGFRDLGRILEYAPRSAGE